MTDTSSSHPGASWPGGRTGAALALAAAGVLVAIQQFASVGGGDALGRSVNNSLHVPLFAVLAWLLDRVLGRPGPLRLALACGALALATEAAQIFTARNASLLDLSLDALGAVPVIAALAASRRSPALRASPRRRLALWFGIAGLIAVLTVAHPLRVLLAYHARDQAFPVLFAPVAPERALLVSANSPAELVAAPPGWPGGGTVLAVRWADLRYPGLTVAEVVGDWGGFDELVVEAYLPAGPAMPLTIALGYAGRPGTAAYARQQVQPGYQRLRYPLVDLLPPAGDRGVVVSRLIMHSTREAAGRQLFLGTVRLERASPARSR